MEHKTKITAENGKQEVMITREFELPVELLFQAHVDPDIVGQWMGTSVLKLDAKKHGSYQYEKKDARGNVVLRSGGVIHEVIPNTQITRTFEMENTPLGVQLEFLTFGKLTDDTSILNMHVIYESVGHRDLVLKMPFTHGLNMAHNRLQEIVNKFK